VLRDFYNRKYRDEIWRPLTLRPDAWSTSRYDDVARLLRRESGRLLEVGCGSGQLVLALAASDQFAHLTGLDLSDVRITAARHALAASPQLTTRVAFEAVEADAPLPAPNGAFDAVLCCAVLEHVVDVFGLLRELARVCKVGGALLVTVPNVGYVKHLLGLSFGRLPLTGSETRNMTSWESGGWDGGHLHYFTRSSLRALLRHTGFRDEAWTSDGRLARLRRALRPLGGNLTVRARRVVERP
jgi:2-polyprenyl-3-methyl-5-hydroxy-6-metoxy-1,4-benzoquinol methylase